MPEISPFYGIVIRMFFNGHTPPHFHASYAEDEALIEIENIAVFAGSLPPRALGLVTEWAALHQEELMENWRRARAYQSPTKIEPLR